MAKLYPPVIEGTIPAFYGTTLVVPFSMNRAVAMSDIKGFSLKIKTVQTNTFVKNLNSTDYTSSSVNFDTTDAGLVAGQYYKLQLAYIFNDTYSTVGYYSTVGVVKYYGEDGPEIYVDGLSSKNSNMYTGSYLGVFEHPDDPMEKVAQYRFIIQDSTGNIVTDTGWLVHNTINDLNSLSSNDSFKYDDDLDYDKVYYLYYKVITSNNMECSTPGYRILQKNSVGLPLDIGLKVKNNFDNGYVSIEITSPNPDLILTGSFEISRQNIRNPKHWEPIFVFVLQGDLPGHSTWKDFTVEQGETYKYCIRQFNASGLYSERVLSNEIYVDFEDAFLYDGQRQLKIRYNPKVSSFKNDILESKTDTIGSKYPFIFRNGHVNYKEFPISGLISYWSDEEHLFMSFDDIDIFDGETLKRKEELPWKLKTTDLVNYNIAAERKFKLEALEWLTNGKPKLFRSPNEGNYIVRLLNTSLTPTDTVGRMLHTFSSTAYEVSEISYAALAGYGFIKASLTDDETQRRYYRSVLLGWEEDPSKCYILTEDEEPKSNKEYYYDENNKYVLLDKNSYELEEGYLDDFNRYKDAHPQNLYEIDYMPVITGKNKQYPVDDDGYVELLTNPYNKEETLKALTIRFDDMSSSDIIYVNGQRRMIGGTGVYNLDNDNEIYSVKVRSVADFYKDDYESAYREYEAQINALQQKISNLQTAPRDQDGNIIEVDGEPQYGLDELTIMLEDLILEINDYIINYHAEPSEELIQAYENAKENLAKLRADQKADETLKASKEKELVSLRKELNSMADKTSLGVEVESYRNQYDELADQIGEDAKVQLDDQEHEVIDDDGYVVCIDDDGIPKDPSSGMLKDIAEREALIAQIEADYDAIDKDVYDGLKERKDFIDQIKGYFDDSVLLRYIQAKFAKLNTILKDLGVGTDKLGLGDWYYQHKWTKKYGHYFIEKGTATTTTWESTPIKNALTKLSKGVTKAGEKLEEAKKPLKDDEIDVLTRKECEDAKKDCDDEVADLIKEAAECWAIKNNPNSSPTQVATATARIEAIIEEQAEYQDKSNTYAKYLVDYKDVYDNIDDWLDKEKQLKKAVSDLNDIHEDLKPLFRRVDEELDPEKNTLFWKYFFDDSDTNFGKASSQLWTKPDAVKTSYKAMNPVPTDGGAFELYLKVEEENFKSYKDYYIKTPKEDFEEDDETDMSNIIELDDDNYLIPYEEDKWVEDLYEENFFKNCYKYQDIYTFKGGIDKQTDYLEDKDFESMEEKVQKYDDIEKEQAYVEIMRLGVKDLRKRRNELYKTYRYKLSIYDNFDTESEAEKARIQGEIDVLMDENGDGLIKDLETAIANREAEILAATNAVKQARNAINSATADALDDNEDLNKKQERKEKLEQQISAKSDQIKRLKNQLEIYIMNEKPDKRSYLHGNTWDNEILNDYEGVFTYSYIDKYSNSFDLITGQSLLDVPCYQINSADSTQDMIAGLSDTRKEVMNILQLQAELKQVENIYYLDPFDTDGLIADNGEPIVPEHIKDYFSLDKVYALKDDDLQLIENPTFIYQIFPILTHESETKHKNESGILFGFVKDEKENPHNSNPSEKQYTNFIELDIAENDEQAEWHSPSFLHLSTSKDPLKYYPITFFSEEEFNSFIKEEKLYKENSSGLKEHVDPNSSYDESANYYTVGKEFVHVTHHRNELYYTDVSFYKIIKRNGKYYLDTTNPYYNFEDENKNGYFLLYDPNVNGFRITKGYSSKIYINTGITNPNIRWKDGVLCDENDNPLPEPYLDLAITQEFKTDLIPKLTDLYVGNGVIVNLSYHAREIDYGVEGDNEALRKAKRNWEKALDDYNNLFYTKVGADKYNFTKQRAYWNQVFNGSQEAIQEAINDAENKRQAAKDAYTMYVDQLQKALDMREAQHSWEKYQEVNGDE